MLEFLKNLFKKTPKVEKVDLASRFDHEPRPEPVVATKTA